MSSTEYRTAWETCPSCSGSGLQNGLYGPVACGSCNGQIDVRIRDERGRFTTRPLAALSGRAADTERRDG